MVILSYNYTYNGYYISTTSGEEEEINYYELLSEVTDLPKVGDYLLLLLNGNISLYKYNNSLYQNNNGFINIDIPNKFLYYSVNGSSGNDKVYYILTVNNNTVTHEENNEFEPTNNLFTGVYDENDENSEEGDYCLNLQTGNLLKKISNSWIQIITGLSITYFETIHNDPNDRTMIINNTKSDNIIIKTIEYNTKEYQGFQGFYKDDISLSDNNNDVINNIINLKLGRDIVIGDTLLAKNDDIYSIYIVTDSENNIKTISLTDEYILYYNLYNLNIIKINRYNIFKTNSPNLLNI